MSSHYFSVRAKYKDRPRRFTLMPCMSVKRTSNNSYLVNFKNSFLCIFEISTGMFWDSELTHTVNVDEEVKERILSLVDDCEARRKNRKIS